MADDLDVPDVKPARAVARVRDAILLDDGVPGRALWQGRPAAARLQHVDIEEARTIAGMARRIGSEDALPLSAVRLAVVDEQGRALVIFDDVSGVSLGDLVAHVMKEPPRTFPIDVACRLALRLASLTTWMPRMGDVVVTWDGLLRASPVPMLPSAGRSVVAKDDLRALSPALVRGEPPDAVRDSLYAAGVVAFELISGTSPFDVDKDGGALALLSVILQSERIPLLRRRDDVGAPLAAAVDGMVSLRAEQHVAVAHARAVLGARACSEDEGAAFLKGFVADAFPRRRAADVAFWEEAHMLDDGGVPAWKILEEPAPITDLASAWRRISNRANRTD